MNRPSFDARFEDFEGHRSVVVHRRPATPLRAYLLFVPAFGDEMNQMRRMVRLAAEALAERGIASCVFDLHGCGDSSADFSEATVERWLADCRTMARRMLTDPAIPLILVGCRLGAALAVALSARLPAPPAALIGWAPVLQGRAQLSGLLRMASVARMQHHEGNGSEPEGPDAKSSWAAGQPAMLGGYPVSSTLAKGLELLDGTAAPRVATATLIDVRIPVGDVPVTPSELMRKRAASWTEQGTPTQLLAVGGASFWNVADLVDVPELIDATVGAVEQILPAATA